MNRYPLSARRLPGPGSAALVLIVLLGAVGLDGADASNAMTYTFNGPESVSDVRYVYHWEILRAALDKTRERYGPCRMISSEVMTQLRQAYELNDATGKITVMVGGSNVTRPESVRNIHCIPIPIDKGLVGYRIFLIRSADQHAFHDVATLDDLRRFSFGLGFGWLDIDVMRQSGFTIVTGSDYDGLFEMLENRRFDAFSRGAFEVIQEFEHQKSRNPTLGLEDSICLYYPLPLYFWFAKSDEGRRLAARAEEGMRMMIDDGTYDRIFDLHYRHQIETLRLKERKLFRIENPKLGPEAPLADARLWFDPQTYVPSKE